MAFVPDHACAMSAHKTPGARGSEARGEACAKTGRGRPVPLPVCLCPAHLFRLDVRLDSLPRPPVNCKRVSLGSVNLSSKSVEAKAGVRGTSSL